jgi:hypothetical protein
MNCKARTIAECKSGSLKCGRLWEQSGVPLCSHR